MAVRHEHYGGMVVILISNMRAAVRERPPRFRPLEELLQSVQSASINAISVFGMSSVSTQGAAPTVRYFVTSNDWDFPPHGYEGVATPGGRAGA